MQHFLGIDVGTQGARCIVVDKQGSIAASASRPFGSHATLTRKPGWHEQNPEQWWRATATCIADVLAELGKRNIPPDYIRAVSVDSTSGTILPIDAAGRPLRPAIMYNDARAEAEAAAINQVAAQHCRQHGYRFSSSYALAKILWIKNNEPCIFDRAHRFIHATDYIIGCLTGDFATTDLSSALKTGCNIFQSNWPRFIPSDLGIPLEKLPDIVKPGTLIANLCLACTQATGLSLRTKAVAGVTDGTAGFLSSGASQVGDFNSTLGTTLVVKGIAERIVIDPEGRLYSHRHPSGYWLPGGASNVGGECLARQFADSNLAEMDKQAIQISPTGLLAYPLERTGERFPFAKKDAKGFLIGNPKSETERYAVLLEGVAHVERMCYDLLTGLGADVSDRIFATGGGSKSREWLQIRADILDRPMVRPAVAESAFGCCLLAASHAAYPSLNTATRAMVHFAEEIEPRPGKVPAYAERHEAFKAECRRRGYIP
ncbi:MAG: FGGY-family carbohydrate kinase [Planctomycetes bacterium]|nr:FGGY-family carbohydrate kinase [Planctomycetota bacterium]